MEIQIDLATPADDAAIRRLLAASPVPGPITLAYEREPSYFLGSGTMGHFCQVAVIRHLPGDAIIGLGCRATRPLFVNGREEEVGYLGQLRIAEPFQGRWLLSRSFEKLRDLHADGRVSGYITTIIAGNRVAEGVLVRRARRHFPAYRPLDTVYTLALVLARAPWLSRAPRHRAYQLDTGSAASLDEIVAFLRREGARRQFFPAYTAADFDASPLTAGFRPTDFVLVRRHGALVGTLGLWDQAAYKQTVVQSYSSSLRRLRPLYNLAAWLLRAPPLPLPGEQLHSIYASFVCVHDDDPQVFRLLLREAYRRATQRGAAYLLLGLTARDPLLPVARRYPHLTYPSQLYTVSWDDSSRPGLHDRLDGRVPYVEIAAL